MQELLRDLRPETMLKVKSKCMKGTRTETINYLMSWITQCSGGVLWCNGIAGTGKSSIVGTLHELLTLHASERNRLAAFIRYDRSPRTEYQNTSQLITSIAYSLGLFDNRIGGAISQVLRKNRSVLGFPESSAKEQFRILIQDPLKSLPELANEDIWLSLSTGWTSVKSVRKCSLFYLEDLVQTSHSCDSLCSAVLSTALPKLLMLRMLM